MIATKEYFISYIDDMESFYDYLFKESNFRDETILKLLEALPRLDVTLSEYYNKMQEMGILKSYVNYVFSLNDIKWYLALLDTTEIVYRFYGEKDSKLQKIASKLIGEILSKIVESGNIGKLLNIIDFEYARNRNYNIQESQEIRF